MPVSVGRSLAIIFTVAGTIFFTRLIPFLFFPKGKEIPPIIRYLGRVLPPAVIGMLVIYCLKNVSVLAVPFGLPEFIAVAAVIVGAATAACGFLPPDAFPAFIVLVAVMAVACAWFNGPTMTLTQRNVPDDKMGRAMGLLTAAMGLATPIGIAIGGVAAEAMGVAPFFIVDGLACLALGLALYLPKSVRALDEG